MMLKKMFICAALIVAGLLLYSSTAQALVHDAVYHWYYNSDPVGYGTHVVDQTDPGNILSYTIGDVSGDEIVQVWEKVYDEGEGIGHFLWTVTNDDTGNILIPASGIYSFRTLSWGYEPVITATAPDGWTFKHVDKTYYEWKTTTAPIVSGTSLNLMTVDVSTLAWGISNGAVDYYDGEGYVYADGGGNWRVSHPVPEPISLLLLGSGLLSLAALGSVRKKRS